MNKIFMLPVALAALGINAFAAPETFDFKDPKGVNNVVFRTDAPLESINGTGTGISGKVVFDPENPANTKGTITLEVASLRVPNPTMEKHLQSDKWLYATKFPHITFEAAKLENVKGEGNKFTADVTGTLTLHGVSKTITVPLKLTYLKDKLHDRFPMLNGDLLVLRSDFTVKRSDFGINKGTFEDKVSNEIELTLSLAGQSPR